MIKMKNTSNENTFIFSCIMDGKTETSISEFDIFPDFCLHYLLFYFFYHSLNKTFGPVSMSQLTIA